MVNYTSESKINLQDLEPNTYWSGISGAFPDMHRIHWYPAKFPPALVKKSIETLEKEGVGIKTIVDCFCGCGTTSLETQRLGYDFWGCDINPVATLIARVKSNNYRVSELEKHYNNIITKFKTTKSYDFSKYAANERINYWFREPQIRDLAKLLYAIDETVSTIKYKDFFYCAYSNILRPCSKWLMKSIKPQVDPKKDPADVLDTFSKQFDLMVNASKKLNDIPQDKKSIIKTENFLDIKVKEAFADAIITSPPYVTSYEYADLHQLSSIWLGYVDDYRDLRCGTIGSRYKSSDCKDIKINYIGKNILEELEKVQKNRVKEIAKYFIDMNKSIQQAFKILKFGGGVVFVIGNTSYKGVYIDNAKYLSECMLEAGFKDIKIEKREVKNKILTSYRDKTGKFSRDPKGHKVYSVEFIVTARKLNGEGN